MGGSFQESGSVLLGGQAGEGFLEGEQDEPARFGAEIGTYDAQLLHSVHQLGGSAVAEIQGALKVKKRFPDTLLMFVTPPSAEELKNRLVGRGTETMDVIESRLARALEEAEGVEEYDYLVVNDELEACVEEVHSIIHNEHYRVSRNTEFISEMREELKCFTRE